MPPETDASTYSKKPRTKQWRKERADAIAAGRVRNQERAAARRAASEAAAPLSLRAREGGGPITVQPGWREERAAALKAIEWLPNPVPLSEGNSTPVLGFTNEVSPELAKALREESESRG